ncbi:MAG: RNA polymerase sigma factor [Actinobacteria bacterium]|nr:RNA polymerase sigma factor [Actinomycetota bacterium]
MEPDAAVVRVPSVDSLVTTPDLPAAATAARRDALTAPPFTDFYRVSRDEVARALALTLGDAHLAAEAADEAMARAYARWAKVGEYDNPAGWVYRVGLNWATSVVRRRWRRDTEVHRDLSDVGPIAEPAVRAALAELDLRHRSVVVCRYYLQMSVAEIAAALNTAPGTVKSRLHRAMRTLQSRLSHLAPDAPKETR